MQLYNILFNQSFGETFLPTIKAIAEIVGPVFAYFTIRFWKGLISTNKILDPMLLELFGVSFAGVTVLFGFVYVLSDTFVMSNEFLNSFILIVIREYLKAFHNGIY